MKVAAASLFLFLAAPSNAQPNKPITVIATFSILGDMVKRIGGEHIALTTLVGPDGDVHVYQPTPADARAVGSADLLFVNGLGCRCPCGCGFVFLYGAQYICKKWLIPH